jgi:hypothetical protein
MITFFKSLKSIAYSLLIVIIAAGITFSSCSGQQSGDSDTNAVEEETTETSEHPEENSEHPSEDSSEEHPNDTTSATWKEDGGGEHPDN